MKIVISSGHGKYVRGASGYIDEVDEARRVVNQLGTLIPEAVTFHDDTSTKQDQNLKTIVNFHNSQDRELDVSVHFNAYTKTQSAMGTEVLYVTQEDLALRVAKTISSVSGIVLHGTGVVYRPDLYFLNKTHEPAILIETCFVDSAADVEAYQDRFEQICRAIASMVPTDAVEGPFRQIGKASHFGGPEDTGVTPSEDLAWWEEIEDAMDDAPELFLSKQPPGTTGLARRLNPQSNYIAMRWDYDDWSKADLASGSILFWVKSLKTGKRVRVRPSDWGPALETGRVCDLSPGVMEKLGIETDDEVEITLCK